MAATQGYGPRVFVPRKLVSALCLPLLAALLLACGDAQEDDTPVGALMLFLEAMDQGGGDSDALERAYHLLNEQARRELDERARKAETLAGRAYEPWEMLAQGRFRLRFAPARHRMRAKIDGDRASVSVSDASGEHSVQVPMVREDKAWRVVLDVPPMYQPPATGT